MIIREQLSGYRVSPAFLIMAFFLAAAFALAATKNDKPAPAEPGLVVHYTFDEGQGNKLVDHSGNGHDGKIVGAQWIKTASGAALAFGHKGQYVDGGPVSSFALDGDMTLEAWIRPTSLEARDRLILGDDASLAVNRIFSFGIDKGMLFFGYGNGHEYEAHIQPVLQADVWQYLAVIVEYPSIYFYRDGRLVKRMAMSFPITRSPLNSRILLGGWWAGQFQGEMKDIRLYRRALPEREILAQAQGRAVKPELTVALAEPNLLMPQGPARAEVAVQHFTGDGYRVDFSIVGAGRWTQHMKSLLTTGRWTEVFKAQAVLKESRPGSERGLATFVFPLHRMQPGLYRLRAEIRDRDGKLLKEASLDYRHQKLGWLGSKAGRTDQVLPPFTPIDLQPSGNTLSASVWGRRYTFAEGPFLSQIASRGTNLLAGPVQLAGSLNGQPLAFHGAVPRVAEDKPARATLVQKMEQDGLELSVKTTIEYDGFVKLDWRLTAQKPVTLDRLAFEIPLAAPLAKYLYTWPAGLDGRKFNSGVFETGYTSPFKPIVWAGDEDKGLSWFAETDEPWHLADAERAIQVVRRADAMVLVFHLVTVPTPLAAQEQISYSFALQATPIKPVARDAWDYRWSGSQTYGHDYDMLTGQINGRPALEEYKALGVRTLLIGNWTDALAYFKPLGHEDQLRAMVQACHRNGIKLIPYFGYQISEKAPEYGAVREVVIRIPEASNPDLYPGMRPQNVSTVCLKSMWQDALVDGIARLMDDYDIDGIYLDSTCMPWDCRNASHGCGYRGRDGQMHSTYSVFAVRETFKRLYTVVKTRKPDGIVDAHVFDCMNAAALAFSTSYWTGEQLGGFKLPDGLSLDRFRAEMMGCNWGVPAEFLHYMLGTYPAAWSIALIHDVPVRPGLYEFLVQAAPIWKLMDDFGRKEAEYMPYWKNAEYLTVKPAKCYASLYRHSKNGVLLIVSNLSAGDADIELNLSLDKLGLAGALAATDGLTGKPVTLNAGKIQTKLPSLGWQTVWIRTAK